MTIAKSTKHLYLIPNYSLSRWMKIPFVMFLLLLALFLRIASLDYLDASDNYNTVAYKNIYQNGISYYQYSRLTTKLTQLSVNTFGFKSSSLRIPSIIYTTVTLVLLYFLVAEIHSIPAVISLFLFAISPWSIALSRVTRDYAFDCMVSVALLLAIYQTFTKLDYSNRKDITVAIAHYLGLAFAVYLFTILDNRVQTKIVILFPLTAAGYTFLVYLQRTLSRRIFLVMLSSLFLLLIVSVYYVHYVNFKRGFLFDSFYFDVFFSPSVSSPWQWFHGISTPVAKPLLFLFFLLPLFFALFSDHHRSYSLVLLYLLFFVPLIIFVFKFRTHLNYTPTRYVYFLFPLYVCIYSLSLFYFVTLFPNRKNTRFLISVFIAILCLKLLNITELCYAVFPKNAYANTKVDYYSIDNIGVGRFKMNKVVTFLKDELHWDNSDIYVFCGRYAEFILLLDYEMDPNRFLLRWGREKYDVGKNMYVESSYFNYHELQDAVSKHSSGYFVTQDLHLTDANQSSFIELSDNDFIYFDTPFEFIKNINGFRIYRWSHSLTAS